MKHFNISIPEWIGRFFNVKGYDQGTSLVTDTITQTLDVFPLPSAVSSGSTGVTGGVDVLLTTSLTEDTYLWGVSVTNVKNSTCSVATGNIAYLQCTPFNQTAKNIVIIAGITLTASETEISFMLPKPILLKRGTNIQVVNSAFGAGSMVTSASVIYSTNHVR